MRSIGMVVPLGGSTFDTMLGVLLFGSVPSGRIEYVRPALVSICSAPLRVLPTRLGGTTAVCVADPKVTRILEPLGASRGGAGSWLITTPAVIPLVTFKVKPALVAADSAAWYVFPRKSGTAICWTAMVGVAFEPLSQGRWMKLSSAAR